MIIDYAGLLMSPNLKSKPTPTNRWWTDSLIVQRQNNGAWVQQQFDGNGNAGQLWAYPWVVQPAQTGKTLLFPDSWVPNSSTSPVSAQGAFNLDPGVFVENDTGTQFADSDVVLGDFSGTTYPAGWVTTGGLAGTATVQGGTWPGESPAITGLMGSACINTYRGTNATSGALKPTSNLLQHYSRKRLVEG